MFHPQNWMAYEQYPSAWKAKEFTVIVFSENELPTAESSSCSVQGQYAYLECLAVQTSPSKT